jgi:hypothetical protein
MVIPPLNRRRTIGQSPWTNIRPKGPCPRCHATWPVPCAALAWSGVTWALAQRFHRANGGRKARGGQGWGTWWKIWGGSWDPQVTRGFSSFNILEWSDLEDWGSFIFRNLQVTLSWGSNHSKPISELCHILKGNEHPCLF